MASVTNQVSSAVKAAAITPADNVALANGSCRGIYVGGTGNVSVILDNDTVAVTFTAVPTGVILPVFAKYVQATGTTATALVALY